MVLSFFRHPAHFLYVKTNSEAKIGKAIKTNQENFEAGKIKNDNNNLHFKNLLTKG